MALEIQERHAVVQGIPLVQISDRNFWFGKPTLVLHLVHLTLFQVLISCFLRLLGSHTRPLYVHIRKIIMSLRVCMFYAKTSVWLVSKKILSQKHLYMEGGGGMCWKA